MEHEEISCINTLHYNYVMLNIEYIPHFSKYDYKTQL